MKRLPRRAILRASSGLPWLERDLHLLDCLLRTGQMHWIRSGAVETGQAGSDTRFNERSMSRGLACAVACVSLLAAGCLLALPVRAPTRTTDASTNPIDLTFLKIGATTRDQVVKNLGSIDTGIKQEDFFWGRLRISNSAVVGTLYNDKGGLSVRERTWGVKNLFVDFDQRGIVKSWTLAGDGKLLEQLDLLTNAATATLDLSSPATVNSVRYWLPQNGAPNGGMTAYASLTLRYDSLECFGVTIARSELRKIALSISTETDHLSLQMFFAQPIDFRKTPLRKRTHQVALTVDPATLLLLRRYQKQTPPIKSGDVRECTINAIQNIHPRWEC